MKMRSRAFPSGLIVCAALALNVPALAAEKPSMTLLTFDGDKVPVNRAGDTYPSEYVGAATGGV